MDLTAKLIPVMVQTVEKFTAMGASTEHIASSLSSPESVAGPNLQGSQS
jgi:hypothetical protein